MGWVEQMGGRYDAAYSALSEALQYPLLTRDARLARARDQDVEVRVR